MALWGCKLGLSLCLVSLCSCGGGTHSGEADNTSNTSQSISSLVSSQSSQSVQAVTFTNDEMVALQDLSPARLPEPPVDLSNRFADDLRAAEFGKKLFFDTSFSGRLLESDNDGGSHALGKRGEIGKVSCAGCHIPDAGFADNRSPGKAISLAAAWGRRRAQSLLDVGQSQLLMWDGRHDSFQSQVFGPIESAAEMNSSRLFVAQQLARKYRAEYESIFGDMPGFDDAASYAQLSPELNGCQTRSFGIKMQCDSTSHGTPGDQAEYDSLTPQQQDEVTRAVINMGKALGAYQRRLSCGPGRFDAWMQGDKDALTATEQEGAKLFVGKGQCTNCHSGPYFSDQKFHNVGLRAQPIMGIFTNNSDVGAQSGWADLLADPLNTQGPYSDGDDGRLPNAIPPETLGSFKTPTLRCVSRRPTFMHTGQMTSLQQVILFFGHGGEATGFPGKNELQPLALNAQEVEQLVAFMKALDGTGPDPTWMSP